MAVDKIYLVGFMAAGKTTVARELAARLGWRAEDVDELIEARERRTVADLFARQGEPYFRGVERDILRLLLPLRHVVIATGGGTFVDQDNRAAISEMAWSSGSTCRSKKSSRASRRTGDGRSRPTAHKWSGCLRHDSTPTHWPPSRRGARDRRGASTSGCGMRMRGDRARHASKLEWPESVRYLILSDIHSNLDALEAVLESLEGRLGSAARPGRPRRLRRVAEPRHRPVRSLKPIAIIRGNHDKAASRDRGRQQFQSVARVAALWTVDTLTPENRDFLRSLPAGPVTIDERVEICHGAPFDEDHYIFDTDDARRAFETGERPLCLFGHTHLPVVFRRIGEKYEAVLPEGEIRRGHDRGRSDTW